MNLPPHPISWTQQKLSNPEEHMPANLKAVKSDDTLRDEAISDTLVADLVAANLEEGATVARPHKDLISSGRARFAASADHYRQAKIKNLAQRENLLRQLSENTEDGLQIDGLLAALEVTIMALPGSKAG